MDYDGIILGTGHNSLILQAYLGKAGFKTLSLDRLDTPGGGLTTLENPERPGFLHNTHSFFHRALTQMPWYRDLALERHGARYIEPELNVALILKSGETLEWWTDFEKTAASFERFSVKDARTLRRWRDDFQPVLEKILIPESQSPPLPPNRRQALLERTPEGRLLLEVSRSSRHHIPALLASKGKAQMCEGGSANLAKALVAAVVEHGGEVRLETTPQEILVENGRAVGVRMAAGEVVLARRFVASGLNPQQTFLDLLKPDLLPREWRDRAARFQYNLIAPLFALNLALSEPPRYRASERNPHLDQAFMVILGLEGISAFPEIVRHHEAGTIPPTVMWGATPTLFDPSQAPAGRHTAFMWEKLPYRLQGNPHNWDAQKEAHGRRLIRFWSEYAPNLKDAIEDSFVRSALDTERTFPNMREGDLLVGAFANGQIGYHRPFPGAGHYRGHLEGLYLCGSCCHPGGNITGLPGYNCAQVILADQGVTAPRFAQPA
jgi:phytoene dehydrogenase-like protein